MALALHGTQFAVNSSHRNKISNNLGVGGGGGKTYLGQYISERGRCMDPSKRTFPWPCPQAAVCPNPPAVQFKPPPNGHFQPCANGSTKQALEGLLEGS